MLVSNSIIVEKVRETDFNTGNNAATGEFEDLIAAGIIDPARWYALGVKMLVPLPVWS